MKNTLIYWISTGILSLMMLFSGYAYLTNENMEAAFDHIGYPDYFRIELAVAKILGVIVLLIPAVPQLIKEWAYAGFAITFISALIAHSVSGDPASVIIAPFVALLLLATSRIYLQKKEYRQLVNA